MHLIPETGAMNQKEFFDEYFLIQKVSKLLPINYYLVVKPNPYAFKLYYNQYSLERYRNIDKIPNVVLVSPDINSELLLRKCISVISVAGSSSLEILFYDKPGFVFGKTEFSEVKGVHLFNEKNFIKIINEYKNNNFDRESFKSYIANVLKWGVEKIPEDIIYSTNAEINSNEEITSIHKKIINIIEKEYLNK